MDFLTLQLLVTIIKQLNQLSRQGNNIMATVQEIEATLDGVAAGVNELEAAISDLKQKVTDGGVATQADLDAIADKAAAIGADIADTSDQG